VNKRILCSAVLVSALAVVLVGLFSVDVRATSGPKKPAGQLSPLEELGKRLFFDAKLSVPEGQSCAVCHSPLVGWTGPDEAANKQAGVYEGAVKSRFGNRKPPASAYAGDSPRFHIDQEGEFVGGMFWDGRATGETLGDPLAEQAMGPFLNPLEQNCPDAAYIVSAVRRSDYAGLFHKVWGPGSLDAKDPQAAYEKIARSIAAYERSAEVNPFSSKFDDFWRKAAAAKLDVADITEANAARFENLGLEARELEGLILFAGKGKCAACHSLDSVGRKPPVFTDFKYDNLGVPRNPKNPFYRMAKEFNPDGKDWVDPGLGGYLREQAGWTTFAASNMGKHKVPTLRNADRRPAPGFVKAFMHNGCFTTLEEIVRFYNTRDKAGARWPAPEVMANINTAEMGNLGLTPEEEGLIVLFLKTLTDR